MSRMKTHHPFKSNQVVYFKVGDTIRMGQVIALPAVEDKPYTISSELDGMNYEVYEDDIMGELSSGDSVLIQ